MIVAEGTPVQVACRIVGVVWLSTGMRGPDAEGQERLKRGLPSSK